jgi:hypothetical protein
MNAKVAPFAIPQARHPSVAGIRSSQRLVAALTPDPRQPRLSLAANMRDRDFLDPIASLRRSKFSSSKATSREATLPHRLWKTAPTQFAAEVDMR